MSGDLRLASLVVQELHFSFGPLNIGMKGVELVIYDEQLFRATHTESEAVSLFGGAS